MNFRMLSFRWLWLDHVPRELQVSPQERAEVLRLAKIKRVQEPKFRGVQGSAAWFLTLTTGPLSILFLGWIFTLVSLRLRVPWFVVSNLTGILLFNLLLWASIAWAMYRTNAPYIRWALCQINKPVCINCGYILTGADDPHRPCPECGEQPQAKPGEAAEADTPR